MKEPSLANSTAELICSLPTLPKERLLVLWRENFGKPADSIRAELMIPILAFRIQEKAYGGLDVGATGRLREFTASLAPKSRIHSEARCRFKPGTRLVREWQGEIHGVILTDDGYEHQGKKYKSPPPLPARSPALAGQVPPSSEQRRKESKSDPGGTLTSMRDLYPQIPEEGLDQSFDSLHAQREACEAYTRTRFPDDRNAPDAYSFQSSSHDSLASGRPAFSILNSAAFFSMHPQSQAMFSI
jgi:Protein of unknown function (DUF2924)